MYFSNVIKSLFKSKIQSELKSDIIVSANIAGQVGDEAEEWRAIKGHPNYKISNCGRVMSMAGRNPRIMKAGTTQFGHQLVCLGKGNTRYIHAMVLEAFGSPRPEGQVCRHIDGNTKNNHPSNLEWGTQSENMVDCVKHGTSVAKLTSENVHEIRAIEGKSLQEIADLYGVTKSTISTVRRGKTWKHIN